MSTSAHILAVIGLSSTLAAAPAYVTAQTDVTVEFGASQIGPPVGSEGDYARFVMGGLRGGHYAAGGSGLFGSVLLGRTLDGTAGGSFLSGMVEGTLVGRLSRTVTAGFETRVLGYGVQEPFPYRAFAAEGGPALRLRTPSLSLKLAGVGGVGQSQLKLWRVADGPSRLFENDLWRAGGTAEVMVGPATSSVGLVAGLHRTPSGNYGSAGARVVFAGAWGVAEIRVDRWQTPTNAETTGGLALVVPIGAAWSLRGFFGRSDPDPLTLAQPGSGGGGFLIGMNLLTTSDEAIGSSGPFEVIEYGVTTSRVRLRLDAPEATTSVALLGDFTIWEPVEMVRSGDEWSVEIDVPVGTHHFGFLVDNEWFVPEDVVDVVPDEWGRMSAILVIEGVER